MKTVVLYNIISFIIIVALIFVLRIVSKSNLRQNQQLLDQYNASMNKLDTALKQIDNKAEQA